MRGRKGLVGAFAPENLAEIATRYRFPRFGEVRHLHDQVDIGTANDCNGRLHVGLTYRLV